MALVTANEVKVIMDDTTIPDAIINACITAADALIAKVYEGDGVITDTLKAEIEKWFVAHMVASTPNYRTTTDEKIGEAQVKYTGKFGDGLMATPYGQQVLLLDVTGKMSQYPGKRAASIWAVKSFE